MPAKPLRYDPVSQLFHWITAVLVVIAFTLGPGGFGRLMKQGVDPATRWDIVTHETLGVTIFVLTLLRLLWAAARSGSPRFDLSPSIHRLSKAVQGLLWLLMLVVPLTAVMSLGSEAHPLTLVGGLRIDRMPWIEASPMAHWTDWGDLHGWLGDALIWLAGFHAAAALLHHFVLKDEVLRSMLPSR